MLLVNNADSCLWFLNNAIEKKQRKRKKLHGPHCHSLYIDILKLIMGSGNKLLAQLQSKFPGGKKLKIHLKLKLKPIKLHNFKASTASTRFFNPSYLRLKYHNQIITVHKSKMVIYFVHEHIVTYGNHNRPPCWKRQISMNFVDNTL